MAQFHHFDQKGKMFTLTIAVACIGLWARIKYLVHLCKEECGQQADSFLLDQMKIVYYPLWRTLD